MLTIDKFVTPSPEQWEMVIEGMRNPKDSWNLIDSYCTYVQDYETGRSISSAFFLGKNDNRLASGLAHGGPVHAKYRRMLPVLVTLTAPLYWWKEFDTYRVGVAPNPTDIELNSCSTMHRIHAKEFTLDQFSHEHMLNDSLEELKRTIDILNDYRLKFLEADAKVKAATNSDEAKEFMDIAKVYWWQLIQGLPTSYNQTRTMGTNYEGLANMHLWRHDHKQDEWRVVCKWIESLPYSGLMTGEPNELF